MIKISKEDAIKLNKEYGIRFGENGISHTCSCHGNRKTYYLCTNSKNISIYNKIQSQKNIKD